MENLKKDFVKVSKGRLLPENAYKKWEAILTKQIDLQSWKGKDKLKIEPDKSEWFITEHRKDKHSGVIKKTVHIIPNKNVTVVKRIISKICRKKEKEDDDKYLLGYNATTKYKEIVEELMDYYDLHFDLSSFNGGLNRNRHYFPKYYYPMKILEHIGFIRYGKRIWRK